MITDANIEMIGQNQVKITASVGIPNLCYEFAGATWVTHKNLPQDGLQEIIVDVSRIRGTENKYCLQQYRTQNFVISNNVEDWFRGVHFKSADGTSLQKLLFAIDEGPDLPDTSSFFVGGMNALNDILFVEVRYGGGCREHQFQLRYESYDPDNKLLYFVLSHEDNGDMCKALLSETLMFDYSGVPAPDYSTDGTFSLVLKNMEGVNPVIIPNIKLDNPAIIDVWPTPSKA